MLKFFLRFTCREARKENTLEPFLIYKVSQNPLEQR